jgi:hypothetical protein
MKGRCHHFHDLHDLFIIMRRRTSNSRRGVFGHIEKSRVVIAKDIIVKADAAGAAAAVVSGEWSHGVVRVRGESERRASKRRRCGNHNHKDIIIYNIALFVLCDTQCCACCCWCDLSMGGGNCLLQVQSMRRLKSDASDDEGVSTTLVVVVVEGKFHKTPQPLRKACCTYCNNNNSYYFVIIILLPEKGTFAAKND